MRIELETAYVVTTSNNRGINWAECIFPDFSAAEAEAAARNSAKKNERNDWVAVSFLDSLEEHQDAIISLSSED